MRYNIIANPTKFAKIAVFMGEDISGLNIIEAAEKAVRAVERLAKDVGLAVKLRDFGVRESDIPHLAEGVMKVTRLLANNPRKLTLEDAIAIYRQAY